jgi:type I thyroxine 5'-deiodinase
VPALNELYRKYRDRAAFYVVYIQEAHAVDAWQLDDNVKDHVLFASTKTADERAKVANVCMTRLAIRLPAVVDDVANTTERAYTGWPDRLYVIDRNGRVAYKSAAGPFGFKTDGLDAALRKTLGSGR